MLKISIKARASHALALAMMVSMITSSAARADVCSADGNLRIHANKTASGVVSFELLDQSAGVCLGFGPASSYRQRSIDEFRDRMKKVANPDETIKTASAGMALLFLALGSVAEANNALQVKSAAQNYTSPSAQQANQAEIIAANENREVLSPAYTTESCVASPYGFDRHRAVLERALASVADREAADSAASPRIDGQSRTVKHAPSHRSHAGKPGNPAGSGQTRAN